MESIRSKETRTKGHLVKRILLTSLLLIGISPAIHAVPIFQFEFSNGAGDTVMGRIFGLADDTANQAASSILVDSFTGQVGGEFGTATNDIVNWSNITVNSFTVVAGQITSATFAAQDAAASLGTFCIDFGGCISPTTSLLEMQAASIDIGNANGFAGVQFTNITIAEPASVSLLALGLLGLARVRRKTLHSRCEIN